MSGPDSHKTRVFDLQSNDTNPKGTSKTRPPPICRADEIQPQEVEARHREEAKHCRRHLGEALEMFSGQWSISCLGMHSWFSFKTRGEQKKKHDLKRKLTEPKNQRTAHEPLGEKRWRRWSLPLSPSCALLAGPINSELKAWLSNTTCLLSGVQGAKRKADLII